MWRVVIIWICLCRFYLFSFEQITADPNIIGCSFEMQKTMQIKVGHQIQIGFVNIGGFIETGNETRFNEGYLPNHKWRGYLQTEVSWNIVDYIQSHCSIIGGFTHESAHATMGIAAENGTNTYGCMYDHTYRKANLNSGNIGVRLYMYDSIQRFLFYTAFNGYVYSKNTPELPGMKTATTIGINCGVNYRYRIYKFYHLFVSCHERFIARSRKSGKGTICYTTDNIAVSKYLGYPIINETSSFSLCLGISHPLFQSRRQLEVYGKCILGNNYGYVDSRDKINVFSIGATLTQHLTW